MSAGEKDTLFGQVHQGGSFLGGGGLSPLAQNRPAPPQQTQLEPAGDGVAFEIKGHELQFLEVDLRPGEAMIAEAGQMMFKDAAVSMETIFGDGSEPQNTGFFGKLLGGAKRVLSGATLFMTRFANMGGGTARVAFSAPYPGKILALRLDRYGGELFCQRETFLAATQGVKIDIAFQKKIMTGLFGGEGFIMQRLAGHPRRAARANTTSKTSTSAHGEQQQEIRAGRATRSAARRVHARFVVHGVRQVVARLRYDLRRRPAPLCRKSLSAYARQFLEMMQKPDVDQIDGLSPAISIEQKTTSKNPRSTVGTVTEIYDYMRLLWARVGVPYSPATGLPIESQTVSQMVDRVLALPEGTRLYLLAPVVRGRKGEYRKEIAEWHAARLSAPQDRRHRLRDRRRAALDKKLKHDIDVVVDRIVVRKDIGARLADSFETALELSGGLAVAEYVDAKPLPELALAQASANVSTHYAPGHIVFSSKFACPVSGFTIPEIEPRLFSFNNPFGACPTCGGIGCEQKVDADLVVPNPKTTLRKGAGSPWAKSSSPYYMQTLEAWRSTTSSSSIRRGRTCPRRPRTSFSSVRAARKSNSPMTTGFVPMT